MYRDKYFIAIMGKEFLMNFTILIIHFTSRMEGHPLQLMPNERNHVQNIRNTFLFLVMVKIVYTDEHYTRFVLPACNESSVVQMK